MSKQDRIEPRRLKGFRDYLPDLMSRRLAVMDTIRREARLAGFQVIGTPALEYAEILLGQGGEETDKQVYRFTDHGDRAVALRFDLTVPFARFVAEHQGELAFPFKKLQMGDVWRGENTQKGRYREFTQCDLDIIGIDAPAADVDILAVFHRILSEAKLGGPFTISIGHRLILSALIRKTLPGLAGGAETGALVAIDKLAKIGRDGVLRLLSALPGATEAGAGELLATLTTKDQAGDTDLARIAALLGEGDSAQAAEIQRLRETVQTLRGVAKPTAGGGRFVVDLTIARGLGYYTGIVFETTLDELDGFGSVCSGGRYNDLASRFSSRELPGVGGSIGLDRLVAGLEELGRVGRSAEGLVFIAVATADARGYAFELASDLRRAGIAADVGMHPKLGNQFKHADRLGCPVVVTVGSDERERRTVAIKTMADGVERRDLPASELVGELRAVLASQ
jgi:histidyl-tRNA synthetase